LLTGVAICSERDFGKFLKFFLAGSHADKRRELIPALRLAPAWFDEHP